METVLFSKMIMLLLKANNFYLSIIANYYENFFLSKYEKFSWIVNHYQLLSQKKINILIFSSHRNQSQILKLKSPKTITFTTLFYKFNQNLTFSMCLFDIIESDSDLKLLFNSWRLASNWLTDKQQWTDLHKWSIIQELSISSSCSPR